MHPVYRCVRTRVVELSASERIIVRLYPYMLCVRPLLSCAKLLNVFGLHLFRVVRATL
jgi:hypothetical protein